MAQENFQNLVLQQLKNLNEKIDNIGTGFDTLDEKVANLEIKFDTLDKKVNNLETKFDALDAKVDNLETDMSCVKTQLNKANDIVKSILHNQEVANAEIEALKTTTVTNASIQKLDAKFAVLNNRLFQQEAEMQALKIAK